MLKAGTVTDPMRPTSGTLRITGTASYQLAKDELWNAIKRHAGWQDDVAADIKVANTDLHGQYTVKGGDSLSKIARYIYGDASFFQKIFDANRDILKDPNKIRVGQKLRIP